MTRHLFSPLRSSMAALGALGGLLATTPAAAQAPNQIYAQLSEQLAIDTKCQVLRPEQRLAMELFADEYRTKVSPADQSTVATWLEGVKANLANVACNDPRLAGPVKAVQDAATIQQDVWASRVQAIARLRGGTTWATMSEISGVKRSAADRAMESLRGRNREAARQFTEGAALEADRVLSVLCPTMSSARANCPALKAPLNPGEAEYAAAWLGRTEKYAAAMPGARLDGKPVLPAGVSDWGQLYSIVSLGMALATFGLPVPCEVGSYLARLDGPPPTDTVNTTPVTVFSARDGFDVGSGKSGLFGSTLTLEGEWVTRLGSQSMGLVRCQSAP